MKQPEMRLRAGSSRLLEGKLSPAELTFGVH